MRSEPLIESAATVENMDLINSMAGLANLLVSPLRHKMLSERVVELHMIKAFCCLINLVAGECLSAWCWVKQQSWRSDRATDLIFHYVSYVFPLSRQAPQGSYEPTNAADQGSIKERYRVHLLRVAYYRPCDQGSINHVAQTRNLKSK
jgi:hypothetical protein